MVLHEPLDVLDERERGYERVEINVDHLLVKPAICPTKSEDVSLSTGVAGLRLWMYDPASLCKQNGVRSFPIGGKPNHLFKVQNISISLKDTVY